MVRLEQFADADAAAAADLVLVARADAAAGRADGRRAGLLGRGLLGDVVREDDVGVVADDQVAADGDAAGRELVDFLEELRRVDDDAVADDRGDAAASGRRWAAATA